MRRFLVCLSLSIFMILLAGCGHGKSTSSAPASVSVTPSTLSLTAGAVGSVTVQVLNSSGTVVSTSKKTTFTSSNTAAATVSPNGVVCAGTWDANYIVCTPGSTGTSTLTATNGNLSGTATVYTHPRVDRVTIAPATVNCQSVGATQQMAATAFSNGVDVTSSVGPFSWFSNNTSVATIDSNGLATSVAPGSTSVFASVANVSSVPAAYITCAVQSIHLHVANAADTTFTLTASGSTQQLAADITDSAGKAITPGLVWFSTQPAVASVSTTAVATAIGAGTTTVGAACSGTCNIGMAPVYADVVVGSVSGTSSTTIYATGTSATTLIPIDSTANTAGTAITLPSAPNSFVFAPNGAKGYLGSSAGMITLDATANTVSQNTSLPGTVLAVSPDGTRVLVASASAVYAWTSSATETLAITGATAAAFAPDNSRAFILASNGVLYVYFPGSTPLTYALAGVANDVAFLPSSALAYLAGGAPSAITARATCDASLADTKLTPGTPTMVRTTPDDLKLLAADSPGLDVLTRSGSAHPGCPPILSETLNSVNFGQGAFTTRQLIVPPNGSKAYITSNLGMLLVYDVTTGATSTIPLAAGASAFTGGTTLDSTKLYVGASDNAVHLIDVASGADKQQISVSFTPDLVAVKPK